MGGNNLYAFVLNNSINSIDIYGLWDETVHYELTKAWALNYFPEDASELIAKSDEGVDAVFRGRSFLPILGDQGYHFNRNTGGGKDSRMENYDKHLEIAKSYCTWDPGFSDDPENAATHLGIALHPYQDWVAHGDYGYIDEGGVYTVHNVYSPQRDFGDDPTAYPDNILLDAVGGPNGRPAGRALRLAGFPPNRFYAIYEMGGKRISLTEQMTKEALSEFKEYVKLNGGCKCKTYFEAWDLKF